MSNDVSITTWIASIGAVFSGLWGVIWKLQQNKIKDLFSKDEDLMIKIEKKADKTALEKLQAEIASYKESNGITLIDLKREIIEENKKDQQYILAEIGRNGNLTQRLFDKFELFQKNDAEHRQEQAVFNATISEKLENVQKIQSKVLEKITKEDILN